MLESVRKHLQQLFSRLAAAQPSREKPAAAAAAAAPATPTQSQAIVERQWTVLEHAEGEKHLSNSRSLAAHLRALEPRLRSLEADVSRLKLHDLTAEAANGGDATTSGSTTKAAASEADRREGARNVRFEEVGSARVLARDKWKELTARFEASSSRVRACVESIEQLLRVEAFLELFGALVTWCSANDEATERLCKPMPSNVRAVPYHTIPFRKNLSYTTHIQF